jgi:hypothetical protein
MDQFSNFISTLLASRTQAHIFHLQSPSYAQHSALNDYYEEIIPLIDSIIESYQGKYGILKGYTSPSTFKEDNTAVVYFEALSRFVDKIRPKLPQDSYLQNQVDEIIDLIESTKYKLVNLH